MINRRHFAVSTARTLGVLALSPAATIADRFHAMVAVSNELDHELTEFGNAAQPERTAKDEKFWGRCVAHIR